MSMTFKNRTQNARLDSSVKQVAMSWLYAVILVDDNT